MKKVFISYSRKDADFARKLATSLSEIGFDVWLDVEDIQTGTKWSTAIQAGLRAAEALILVMSPDAMASNNVEDEWQYFIDHKKPVIPLLWRPTEIHFQLSRLNYIDFTGNIAYTAAFQKLLVALETPQQLAAVGTTPISPPTKRERLTKLLSSPVLQGISAIVTILAFAIALLPSLTPPNDGVMTPTRTTPTRAAPLQTPTPLTTPGTLDISLIFGTRETSFTIIVRGDSDLNGLELRSSKNTETVTDRFDVLAANFGGFALAGTCLRYVLEGESPPTPDDCDNPIEVSMSEADVFWYDIIQNQGVDLLIYQNDDYKSLCSAATKRCNYP